MSEAEAKLRAIYRELFPSRHADLWQPTDGELVLCAYLDAELARRDKATADLSLRLGRHLTSQSHAP